MSAAAHRPAARPIAPTRPGPVAWLRRHALPAYFALALAGTWAAWTPFLLAENGLGLLPVRLPGWLFTLTAVVAGPTAAALAVTAIEGGRAAVRDLLGRCARWRIGLGWYALALAGFPAASFLAASLQAGAAPLAALLRDWPLVFTAYLPLLAAVAVKATVWEELGWRGFAQPRLQQRLGALRGAAVVGACFALWHVPAFFIAGGASCPTCAPPGLTLPGAVALLLFGVAMSTILAWVHNNVGGSLLLVVLCKASYNATIQFMGVLLPDRPVGGASFLAAFAVAALLIALTRGRLAYRRGDAAPASGTSDAAAGAPDRS